MSEDELLRGIKQGDLAALQEFYADYKVIAEQACAFFLGDHEELKEAVQDILRSQIDRIQGGEQSSLSLKERLQCLAVQRCLPVMQKWLRNWEQQNQEMEAVASKVPVLREITEDAKERVSFMIRGELEETPEPHKQILMMHEIEGLNFLELAKRLNCAWLTALLRLYKAREFLCQKVGSQVKA